MAHEQKITLWNNAVTLDNGIVLLEKQGPYFKWKERDTYCWPLKRTAIWRVLVVCIQACTHKTCNVQQLRGSWPWDAWHVAGSRKVQQLQQLKRWWEAQGRHRWRWTSSLLSSWCSRRSMECHSFLLWTTKLSIDGWFRGKSSQMKLTFETDFALAALSRVAKEIGARAVAGLHAVVSVVALWTNCFTKETNNLVTACFLKVQQFRSSVLLHFYWNIVDNTIGWP